MAKVFLKSFALLVCLGAAAVAGLNWLVDPFSLFGSPRIAGFNANKMDFVEHLRLTNVYAVRRVEPDALVIGTSRVGRGLSPTHPAWQGLACYNLALPGITAYEMLRYLQHAAAVHPLKRVVVGLDFRSFQPEDGPDAAMERRLMVTPGGEANFNLFSALLPDLAASLLSSDALLESLRTVRFQSWMNMTLSERGQWLNLNDRYDHAKGFRVYSANTFQRYAGYGRSTFDVEQAMRPYREILELAHRRGIDLRLVIMPSHAWHWETLRVAGLEPRFEAIKAALVRTNQAVAEGQGRPPFPLWDFSGYNRYSGEPVPSRAGQSMRWFWDPVHFKTELGDLVLDRVFGLAAGTAESDFGVRLDATNPQAHLARWRQAEQAYRADHRRDIEEIESIGRRTTAKP
jgi:hypothetical protein